MSASLRELEKRLEKEPDNLPLRVTVAGMLRAAGRRKEAVEHYRRVAIAYRAQGRPQQALAVCRNILELAPDDAAIRGLVAELNEPKTPVPPAPVSDPFLVARPAGGVEPRPPAITAKGSGDPLVRLDDLRMRTPTAGAVRVDDPRPRTPTAGGAPRAHSPSAGPGDPRAPARPTSSGERPRDPHDAPAATRGPGGLGDLRARTDAPTTTGGPPTTRAAGHPRTRPPGPPPGAPGVPSLRPPTAPPPGGRTTAEPRPRPPSTPGVRGASLPPQVPTHGPAHGPPSAPTRAPGDPRGRPPVTPTSSGSTTARGLGALRARVPTPSRPSPPGRRPSLDELETQTQREPDDRRSPARASQPPASAFARAALVPPGRPSVPASQTRRGMPAVSALPVRLTPVGGMVAIPPKRKSDDGLHDDEAPARRSSFEATPLPRPMPYHLADRTSSPPRVMAEDARDSGRDSDDAIETTPGDEPLARRMAGETIPTGLAQAARRISGLIAPGPLRPQRPTEPPNPPVAPTRDLDLAAALETRERPRLSAEELDKIGPPPTGPTEQFVLDEDLPTPPPALVRPTPQIRDTPPELATDVHTSVAGASGARDTMRDAAQTPDDDRTAPRELVEPDPLANAFFQALPANRREAALVRCIRRKVRAGQTVIRQGETSHPLYLVVAGQLEIGIERANGTLARVDTVEPGDYIGEAALLARAPAAANVIATVDSELLALPPHSLFELAGAYPSLWAALKDTAERRNRQYDNALR